MKALPLITKSVGANACRTRCLPLDTPPLRGSGGPGERIGADARLVGEKKRRSNGEVGVVGADRDVVVGGDAAHSSSKARSSSRALRSAAKTSAASVAVSLPSATLIRTICDMAQRGHATASRTSSPEAWQRYRVEGGGGGEAKPDQLHTHTSPSKPRPKKPHTRR